MRGRGRADGQEADENRQEEPRGRSGENAHGTLPGEPEWDRARRPLGHGYGAAGASCQGVHGWGSGRRVRRAPRPSRSLSEGRIWKRLGSGRGLPSPSAAVLGRRQGQHDPERERFAHHPKRPRDLNQRPSPCTARRPYQIPSLPAVRTPRLPKSHCRDGLEASGGGHPR
jgi:hypothetical protein